MTTACSLEIQSTKTRMYFDTVYFHSRYIDTSSKKLNIGISIPISRRKAGTGHCSPQIPESRRQEISKNKLTSHFCPFKISRSDQACNPDNRSTGFLPA